MAVLFEKNPLIWRQTDGIYIVESDQPEAPEIVGNNSVKIVGEFPWGPPDEVVEVGSRDQLQKRLLGQYSAPEEYGGYRSLVGKQFGPMRIVRVKPSSGAGKASMVVRDDAKVTLDGVTDAKDYTVSIDSTDYTETASVGSDTATKVLERIAAQLNNNEPKVRAYVDSGDLYIVGAESQTWTIAVSTTSGDTIAKTDPTKAVTVTAKYFGAAPNEMEVSWERSGAEWKAAITWGQKTVETDFHTFDAAGMTAAGDAQEWVDFSLHADNGSNPSGSSGDAPMTGGSDGTASDSDWTGGPTSAKGLEVLRQTDHGGFLFAAEYTSSTWRSSLETFLDDQRAQGCAQAEQSDDFDTNATEADKTADDRLSLALHRVQQQIAGNDYTVDLAPFVASLWSQIPPHYSVADAENAEYLQAIKGLPSGVSLSWPQWRKADEVGGITLEKMNAADWKVHAGITSDPDTPSMVRRRMTDVVGASVGNALLPYQNKPTMDTFVDGAKNAVEDALEAMQGEDGIPQTRMIDDFQVTTQSVTSDSVIFQIAVKIWGEMRYLIANLNVGAGVTISEE